MASEDNIRESSLVAEGAKSEVAMAMSEAIEERISDVAGSDGSTEYGGTEPISFVCCGKSPLGSGTPLIKLGVLRSIGMGTRVVSDSAASSVAIEDETISEAASPTLSTTEVAAAPVSVTAETI
jgi:hypothetical protein